MKTNNNYNFNEEFYSIPLYIDSRVLTPRNDTEILVNQVLKDINPLSSASPLLEGTKGDFTLIDVWTWSSCIPIAIVKNSNIWVSYALDISSDALDVASINIKKYSLEDKIKLKKSNLLEYFLNFNDKILTSNLIITANLPYIKNWDFDNMDKEVLMFEPHIALFWWEKTWFELYEKLINQIFLLKEKLNINITLFIEIWFDQYEYSKNYLEKIWLKFEYFKDYNNIYRVIKIYF